MPMMAIFTIRSDRTRRRKRYFSIGKGYFLRQVVKRRRRIRARVNRKEREDGLARVEKIEEPGEAELEEFEEEFEL